MKILNFIIFYFTFISVCPSQTFSIIIDNEPMRNERGKRLVEYQSDLFLASSMVCLDIDLECFNISRISSQGESKWIKKISWMDLSNWESFFITNDTIVISGHSNGSTSDYGQSFLFHRITIENDSLDRFEYPLDIYGYSIANSFGVIEYQNEYYIYGDARRQLDQIAVGIILRINKSGELIQHYEYEGDGTVSHVFDLKPHPTLGLVFMDRVQWPIGSQIPVLREFISFDPNSSDPFTTFYSEVLNSSSLPLTFEIMDDETFVYPLNFQNGFDVRANLQWIDYTGQITQDFEYTEFLQTDPIPPIFTLSEIRKTENNSLLVCGSISIIYGQLPNIESAAHGFIMKVNENAEMVWQRYFVRFDGEQLPVQSHLFDVKELIDGSIVATGYEEVNRNGQIERDVWLLKLDENGCLIEDECNAEQFTTSAIDMPSVEQKILRAYPNPTYDNVNISYSENFRPISIRINDLSGSTVNKINNPTNQINISDINPGIYFLIAKDSYGNIAQTKLIKL